MKNPSVCNVSNEQLAAAVKSVANAYVDEPIDFTCGHCHTLAIALYRAMAAQGVLLAGCYYKTTRGGSKVPTEYIHMVYQAPQGTVWDIGGRNADGRWEEAFGCNDFLWLAIQHESIEQWLAENNATYHPHLTAEIADLLRQRLADGSAYHVLQKNSVCCHATLDCP